MQGVGPDEEDGDGEIAAAASRPSLPAKQEQEQEQQTSGGGDLESEASEEESEDEDEDEDEEGPAVCVICLEGFNNSDVVRRLPDCGHIHHKRCIDLWLRGAFLFEALNVHHS
jgi:hypothetical protein